MNRQDYEDAVALILKASADARRVCRYGYARSRGILVSEAGWAVIFMRYSHPSEIEARIRPWGWDRASSTYRDYVRLMLGRTWEPAFPPSALEQLAKADE